MTEFHVIDATCGHCKATIEQAVSGVEGVRAADLDLESKLLRVQHDESVDRAELTTAISAAGYTAEGAA